MTEPIIYKLLDVTSFNLRLNEGLPKFTLISELLKHNSIPFNTWKPKRHVQLEIVEMAFSVNCKFQDIFLLSYLLKELGLESIFPSRNPEPEIAIGTYLHQVTNLGKNAKAVPIDINTFLKIDPKLNTQIVIDSFFENHFSDEEFDDEDSGYVGDYEQDYDDYYERESYGRYAGSYAQDVAGLSDDFINDVLDGNPDAYWNID